MKGPSGISVDTRVQIKSSEVKQDDRSESLLVAKSTGSLPEGFDLGVDGFGCGVGEPMLDVAHDPVESIPPTE